MLKLLAERLKSLLNKKGIVDILVFGSLAKGKIKVNDIDLAILVEAEVHKSELLPQIRNKVKLNVDVQIITIRDYDKFIWITLLREGYSIKYKKYLHEMYNIKPQLLYKYSLKTLTPSKKVMFERALKQFSSIKRLSNRVVLVPIEKSADFNALLQYWELDIDAEEYALMPLYRKEE